MIQKKLRKLKNAFPEPAGNVEDRINSEILKELGSIPCNRKKNSGIRRMPAIGFAAVLCFSGAFAAVKLSNWLESNKKGNYGLDTGIKITDDNANDTIYKVNFTWNYIPEGMSVSDDGKKLVFGSQENAEGITLLDAVYDSSDYDNILQDINVLLSEKLDVNGHEAIYIQLASTYTYDKRVYVLYPEYNRVLLYYASSSVDKEELISSAGGMSVLQTAEVADANDYTSWRALTETFDNSVLLEENQDYCEIEPIAFGEKAYFETSVKTNEKNSTYESVGLKVLDVRVDDNLSMLETSRIPEEWKNQTDADGKLIPDVRKYVRYGDGINTIAETVAEDTVAQKLVYITLEFTNDSTEYYEDVLFPINLYCLKNTEDGYCFAYFGLAKDNWDAVIRSGAYYDFMQYHKVEGNSEETIKRYIDSLAPGESKKIYLAWIVDEDYLPCMYLGVNGSSTKILETGLYFDIRK